MGSVPDSPFAGSDSDTTRLADPITAQVTPGHAVKHGSDVLDDSSELHPVAVSHADPLLVLVYKSRRADSSVGVNPRLFTHAV